LLQPRPTDQQHNHPDNCDNNADNQERKPDVDSKHCGKQKRNRKQQKQSPKCGDGGTTRQGNRTLQPFLDLDPDLVFRQVYFFTKQMLGIGDHLTQDMGNRLTTLSQMGAMDTMFGMLRCVNLILSYRMFAGYG
jgi:hypothetical protein